MLKPNVMAGTTENIMDMLITISIRSELEATIPKVHCVPAGLITGVGALLGGFIGGSIGAFIGGVLGGWMDRFLAVQYEPIYITLKEMEDYHKQRLVEKVKVVINQKGKPSLIDRALGKYKPDTLQVLMQLEHFLINDMSLSVRRKPEEKVQTPVEIAEEANAESKSK